MNFLAGLDWKNPFFMFSADNSDKYVALICRSAVLFEIFIWNVEVQMVNIRSLFGGIDGGYFRIFFQWVKVHLFIGILEFLIDSGNSCIDLVCLPILLFQADSDSIQLGERILEAPFFMFVFDDSCMADSIEEKKRMVGVPRKYCYRMVLWAWLELVLNPHEALVVVLLASSVDLFLRKYIGGFGECDAVLFTDVDCWVANSFQLGEVDIGQDLYLSFVSYLITCTSFFCCVAEEGELSLSHSCSGAPCVLLVLGYDCDCYRYLPFVLYCCVVN